MIKIILKIILKRSDWGVKTEILYFLISESANYSKARTIAILKSWIKDIEEN
jgi:hypothetical protein